MMCTININTFYLFTKKTWIGNSDASSYVKNNNTIMFDIIKSIQDGSDIMTAMKKGKLCINVWQVDGQ